MENLLNVNIEVMDSFKDFVKTFNYGVTETVKQLFVVSGGENWKQEMVFETLEVYLASIQSGLVEQDGFFVEDLSKQELVIALSADTLDWKRVGDNLHIWDKENEICLNITTNSTLKEVESGYTSDYILNDNLILGYL